MNGTASALLRFAAAVLAATALAVAIAWFGSCLDAAADDPVAMDSNAIECVNPSGER